jgi:hypothetical protein
MVAEVRYVFQVMVLALHGLVTMYIPTFTGSPEDSPRYSSSVAESITALVGREERSKRTRVAMA